MTLIKTFFFHFSPLIKRIYFLWRKKDKNIFVNEFLVEDQIEKLVCYGSQVKVKLNVENLLFITIEKVVIPVFSDSIPITIKYPAKKGKNAIRIRLVGLKQSKRYKISTVNEVPNFQTPRIKKSDLTESTNFKNLEIKNLIGLNLKLNSNQITLLKIQEPNIDQL
jgi:hypothetical protein